MGRIKGLGPWDQGPWALGPFEYRGIPALLFPRVLPEGYTCFCPMVLPEEMPEEQPPQSTSEQAVQDTSLQAATVGQATILDEAIV